MNRKSVKICLGDTKFFVCFWMKINLFWLFNHVFKYTIQ